MIREARPARGVADWGDAELEFTAPRVGAAARSQPLRILYVINSLLRGGAETVVSEWAKSLVHQGHTVDVCTLYTDGPLSADLGEHGVVVRNLGLDPTLAQRQSWRKYDFRGVSALADVIRRGRYEVVHAHLFPTSLFVALASLEAPDVPYVYTEHSVQNRRRAWRVFKWSDAAIYRRYQQIVAVSGAVGRELGAWLPAVRPKIRVVPNAVDPRRLKVSPDAVSRVRAELQLAPEAPVVLFVGRLVDAKNPQALIRAFGRLADTKARLVVVGDGPLRSELERLAVSLDISTRVRLLGQRSDVAALLQVADVLAISSAWEGLPMVLLEAMAAGTPVVSTAVGGIPEVLEHNVNGWLVSPDDESALGAGMQHLLDSPWLRARLARQAAVSVDARYSIRSAARQLVSVYDALLTRAA